MRVWTDLLATVNVSLRVVAQRYTLRHAFLFLDNRVRVWVGFPRYEVPPYVRERFKRFLRLDLLLLSDVSDMFHTQLCTFFVSYILLYDLDITSACIITFA